MHIRPLFCVLYKCITFFVHPIFASWDILMYYKWQWRPKILPWLWTLMWQKTHDTHRALNWCAFQIMNALLFLCIQFLHHEIYYRRQWRLKILPWLWTLMWQKTHDTHRALNWCAFQIMNALFFMHPVFASWDILQKAVTTEILPWLWTLMWQKTHDTHRALNRCAFQITVGTCTHSAPLKKRVIFTLSAPIRTPLNI